MLSPEAKKLGKQPAYPQTGVHGKGITIRQLIMKDTLQSLIRSVAGLQEIRNLGYTAPELVEEADVFTDTLLEEMVKES